MRFYKLFSFLLVLGIMTGISAAEIPFVIKLDSIVMEKSTSERKDELYFSLTKYSSLGHSQTDRVPMVPNHWNASSLARVKDITLWKGVIKDGEDIRLIIALVEQDFPPFDPDEAVGSAEVTLINKDGNLETKWTRPVFEEKDEAEIMPMVGNKQPFIFKGQKAHYIVNFVVQKK